MLPAKQGLKHDNPSFSLTIKKGWRDASSKTRIETRQSFF
jgi:hypothetical protein